MTDWLSAAQVSAKFSIPLRTVQNACATGALASERLGRFYMIRPYDAEQFATRHETPRNGHELS